MSDITCDYCGESGGYKMFLRGTTPSGARFACMPCMKKIMSLVRTNDPAFIDTPLGQTPIDQQRP